MVFCSLYYSAIGNYSSKQLIWSSSSPLVPWVCIFFRKVRNWNSLFCQFSFLVAFSLFISLCCCCYFCLYKLHRHISLSFGPLSLYFFRKVRYWNSLFCQFSFSVAFSLFISLCCCCCFCLNKLHRHISTGKTRNFTNPLIPYFFNSRINCLPLISAAN